MTDDEIKQKKAYLCELKKVILSGKRCVYLDNNLTIDELIKETIRLKNEDIEDYNKKEQERKFRKTENDIVLCCSRC